MMADELELLVLKLASSCNLACGYCSAHASERVPRLLDVELAEKFFAEVLQVCRFPQGELKVLFHGGEPTLYPAAACDRLMGRMREMADRAGVGLSFSIQTNGVHLSDEWLSLIRRWSIGVGVSVDGPADLTDQRRVFADGRGSFESVLRTLTRLKDEGVSASLLSVIDDRHRGAGVAFADWAMSLDLPIKMNPAFSPVGDGASFAENYFDFLKQVLQRIADSDYEGVACFSPIDDWFTAALLGRRMTACALSGVCAARMLCLSPEGEIAPCGRLLDSTLVDRPYEPGTLRETRLAFAQELEAKLKARSARLGCEQCPYLALCHGGCAVSLRDGTEGAWCAAARRYFKFALTDGLSLLKKALIRQKRRAQTRISVAEEMIKELSDEC